VQVSNEALVEEYQNGNDQALNELVEQNKKLVYHFANRYYGMCKLSFLDKDDLIQEGFIGLMEAAEKFEPDRGCSVEGEKVKFSNYASQRIMGRIFRAGNKYVAREKKSDDYSVLLNVNSMNEFIPGSDHKTYEDSLAEEVDQVKTFKEFEHRFDNEILRADLLQLLDDVFGEEFQVDLLNPVLIPGNQALLDKIGDGITPKEVLLLDYGLLGKKMSFHKLSDQINITVTRLRQIESKAIQTIRTSEYLNAIIDQYGEEFRISVDAWKKQRQDNLSFGGVEKQLDHIDNLLNQFLEG